MFKSEFANRIISIVVYLILISFVLFNDSNIGNNPKLLGFAVVLVIGHSLYHLYNIMKLRKSKQNDNTR